MRPDRLAQEWLASSICSKPPKRQNCALGVKFFAIFWDIGRYNLNFWFLGVNIKTVIFHSVERNATLTKVLPGFCWRISNSPISFLLASGSRAKGFGGSEQRTVAARSFFPLLCLKPLCGFFSLAYLLIRLKKWLKWLLYRLHFFKKKL